MNVGGFGGGNDLIFGCVGVVIGNVVLNVIVE